MRQVIEYKDVYTVDGQHIQVPYRVDFVDDFEYISLEQFMELTDFERTKYINDLNLHNMRWSE